MAASIEPPFACVKLGTVPREFGTWARQNRRQSLFVVTGVLAAIFGLESPLPGQDLKKYHVAVLFPSGSSVGGDNPLDTAIQSVGLGPDVVFYPEYLDLMRFPTPDHEESVVRYLRSLYGSQKVDLVLATGFLGLTFALRHGSEIFGETPVVFTGVEQSRLDGLHLPPHVTGVTHFDDVRGTLDVALRLQPDTTEIVVVAGAGEYDRYWLRHDRVILDEFSHKVHLRYLTDLPLLTLLEELRHLNPHTIVYIHTFSRDVANQGFSGAEMLDLLTTNSNAPVYGLTARQGFVGGPTTDDDDQHLSMALEMIHRIYKGEKVANIPVRLAKPKYPYVFDAHQLRRWYIDLNRIPPGSLLLNQEPSIWQLHKGLVSGILSFIALESALIAVLLIQRNRRRRAEMLLADRNARLQDSEHSLRRLTGQLIGTQEEERKRIARQLHDDLNQQVADLGISLSNIKRTIPSSMEDLRGDVSSVQNRLLTLSDDLRHVSHELHPGILELFGLETALKSHCKEFSLVTSIPVELETECLGPLSSDVALCVYRIAQESLRNVARHSRASKVTVRLTISDNVLNLVVSDNGIGFDLREAYSRGGLGIRSMEERARLVHGKVEVTSQPAAGATLVVSIASIDRAERASAH